MLPSAVADDLVSGLAAPADFTRGLDGVTVLFCKIDAFNTLVEGLKPDALVEAPDSRAQFHSRHKVWSGYT